MPYQPGDILFDKYRIAPDGLIGHGSFGDVYRVTHQRLNVPRAIKLLRHDAPGIGSVDYRRASERFLLEAHVGALIQHPNVIKVYEFEETAAELGLVMEYAPGKSLQDRLLKERQLSVAAVIRLGIELCAGLEAIHQRGIVHRDIKPGNILFGEDGVAKIADLGLAQMLGDNSDRSLRGSSSDPHPGTMLYKSPEQESTRALLLPSSDIFSLGCVLFEALTGKPYKLDYGASVSAHRSGVPNWLVRIIARMLREQPGRVPEDDSDPKKRYRLASQVRVALEVGGKQNDVWKWLAAGLGVLLVMFLLIRLVSSPAALTPPPSAATSANGILPSTSPATQTAAPTASPTTQPTNAPVATSTPAPTSTPAVTAVPTLGIGSITTREKDSMLMVYVPEGPFTMGGSADAALKICQGVSTGCQRSWFTGEEPVHTVTLAAFWIDQTEVTNAKYAQCVQAGTCQPPWDKKSYTQPSYYGNSSFSEYPVIYVDWNQAKIYCEWAGGRLPTESEWEKAARGTDGRIYPWGDSIDKTYANYNNNVGDTSAVGQYEKGKSFYGAYDMAGNVWEWVADWYGKTYYSSSPASNPTGPTSGTERVLRGGSWLNNEYVSRVSLRNWNAPGGWSDDNGFRCAR